MKKPVLLAASALLTFSFVDNTKAMSSLDWAKKGDTVVKCKGVAAKGKNDCGANGHACGGKAKKDNDPNEWIYVPEGVCEKLAGGVVAGKKKI